MKGLRGGGSATEPLLPQTHPTPHAGHAFRATHGDDGYQSDLDASGSQRRFVDRPVPAAANPVAHAAHRRLALRNASRQPFRDGLGHHPDRGSGFNEYRRARFERASLVDTGRHAGRSRVEMSGFRRTLMGYHFWKRDFFTSCINLRLPVAVAIMFAAYLTSFMGWGLAWWLLYHWDASCLIGFDDLRNSYVSAFLFATETQQTIGFGARAPADCWVSVWMVVAQSVWGQLLDAVVLGVIFARISHPKQRSRTIFISDSACIARRDGLLKFMVRIGDIRRSSCTTPTVRGALYLWGSGHTTAEGEHIPVRMEEILFEYPAHLELLLPIVLEHAVDERSPLFGHTHESLTALGAEIVVTFEGTSESGDGFLARRSYLPDELHWGFVFAPIIQRAAGPTTHHTIDIARFHDVEPQRDLAIGPPGRLSSKVAAPPRGAVPYPSLTNNTLVLSDCLLLGRLDGRLFLQVRVGDTYPHNMLEVHVRAYVYRWRARTTQEGDVLPYEVCQLALGNETGEDRLLLRLPVTVRHEVCAGSPLARWAEGKAALAEDADSEIVVVVEGVQYTSSRSVMRQRTYRVQSDLAVGRRFAPCVSRPQQSPDGRPLVTWRRFHETLPLGGTADEEAEAADAERRRRAASSGASTPAGRHSRQPSVERPASRTQQQAPSFAFGSVFSMPGGGLGASRGQHSSWGELSEAGEGAAPQPGEQPRGGPGRPGSDGEEGALSGSTLTMGSNEPGDWRHKRSLFNLSFDPDSGDDGSSKGGPASDG